MSDTAGLQIRVEHATARSAADDLLRLRSASREAENSSNALREATTRLAAATRASNERLAVAEATTRSLSMEIEQMSVHQARAGSAMKGSDGAAGELIGKMKELAVEFGLVFSAVEGVKKIIETAKAWDELHDSLKTVTGDAEKAAEVFDVIDEMEGEMPYSSEQLTKAFIDLVNKGLNPSEEALTSYGNIAAGTGKDINTVVDAVASASMGMARSLREFGIVAEANGDKLDVTFRGVTTSIGNNSKEIQEYMISLGKTEFGDAIANKMEGLGGKLHLLGKAWDEVFEDISKSGIGDLIKDGVEIAISACDDLKAALSSDFVSALIAGMRSFIIEAQAAYEIVQGLIHGDRQRINNALDVEEKKMRLLVLSQQQKEFDDENTQALKEYGLEIDNNRKKLAEYQKNADPKKVNKTPKPEKTDPDANALQQLISTLRTEEEKIDASFEERQRIISKKTKEGSALQVQLTYASVALYEKELAALEAKNGKELADLKKTMRSEEQVLRDSYLERRAIVLKDMDEGEDRDALLASISDQYTAELDARQAAKEKELQQIRDNFATEMELFKKQQEEKKQAILENELATAEEKDRLLSQLQKQTDDRMAEEENARNEMILQSSADLFGGLAQTSKNLGGQNSNTYRALFAASKAFSIAEASLGIATGTAKALELGWPAGLAAGLQVAAQGAALLAQITSTNYSGAYDKGGSIPAGSFGIAGEQGPEIVWGPATVTSRQDTARIMQQPAQQLPNLRLIVAPDENAAAKYRATTENEKAWVMIAQKHATELRTLTGSR